MPIYEYHCNACDTDFEAWQKITATGSDCESCGSADTTRKVSASSFVLKGSGWYKTDYASPPKDAKSSKGDGEKSDKSEKSEKSEKSDMSASSKSDGGTSESSAPAPSASKDSKKDSKPASTPST